MECGAFSLNLGEFSWVALKVAFLFPTNECFSISTLYLWNELFFKVVAFLSFDFKRYWSLIGRIIEFMIISVHIYRNLWSIKTILVYFLWFVKYFNLLNEIVFESLYTSHTVMLIEYYFLFGFFWNLWEFRAIIQLSLRSSDVDIHVCDEEYIL